MNAVKALQLHLNDAELVSVSQQGRLLQLRFSAIAAHPIRTDADAQTAPGHALGVLLDLHGVTATEPAAPTLNDLMGRVAGLELRLTGQLIRQLPLPGQAAQDWQLHLQMANGCELAAAGSGWQLQQPGGPRWQAYLHC